AGSRRCRHNVVARYQYATGGQVRASFRNCHRESCPLSEFALHGNRSAVQFDQLIDQGKADAAAFVTAAPGFFNAVKTLEQTGQGFTWDTDAGIAHHELQFRSGIAQLQRNPAFESELEGV